jgi:hypothetical protein
MLVAMNLVKRCGVRPEDITVMSRSPLRFAEARPGPPPFTKFDGTGLKGSVALWARDGEASKLDTQRYVRAKRARKNVGGPSRPSQKLASEGDFARARTQKRASEGDFSRARTWEGHQGHGRSWRAREILLCTSAPH